MSSFISRAKHKENTVYTEDPFYNNRDYHFDWKLFGRTLKRLRVDAHLTQEDLACITGISSSMISQFENAYQSKYQSSPKHPNQEQLICILHALRVDANALFAAHLSTPAMSERDRAVEELVDQFRTVIKQSDFYLHYDEHHIHAPANPYPKKSDYMHWAERIVAEKPHHS